MCLVIGDIFCESTTGVLPFECEKGRLESNFNIFASLNFLDGVTQVIRLIQVLLFGSKRC
jgi:hypothetical protein